MQVGIITDHLYVRERGTADRVVCVAQDLAAFDVDVETPQGVDFLLDRDGVFQAGFAGQRSNIVHTRIR